MDPVLTPLLVLVLGNLARDLITDACKDYLKDKLKSVFGWLEKLGERDKVELAYLDAMEQAYAACLEMLLLGIKSFGYSDEELKQYRSSIEGFIKDDKVAEELLNAVREPDRNELPSPDVLRERWKGVGGQELPSDTLWNAVVIAFRRQATKRIILSDDLRELLNAQNLQQLRELIERQGGVKVQVRRNRYSQRMRTKFSPVDLANLMPAYADDPGRMVIRDVFVAQSVRENPPPVEIPKDLVEHLAKSGRSDAGDYSFEDLDEEQLETLRTTYVSQSPNPVLEVISAPGKRLLVLTGDPGSGKSTLLRYLLTGVIEPPIDRESRKVLDWTLAFNDAFPLLIELRDFYALRRSNECDSFLEYVCYMGKTDQWFLDDHAVDGFLQNGPSLVMFDGLDEIFVGVDRDRVIQEIAGFAQRYASARIIVTSRPVGYKEKVLREAGFSHFGIQDLDDEQIELFIQGWFSLTFPQQPQQAEQRIERVLGSVRQSKPIRLLAGNPMLLTIMALLAREEELPRERAKFYEKAVEVLCHHWDANRHLELPEDRYLNADDKKDLLRRIAMQMQLGKGGLKGNIIQEDDLEQEIQAYLIDENWQPTVAEAKKAARRMIQQLRERNYILCLRGPRLYGFVHRTFLEYLTAAEYVRRFDRQPQQMTIDELIELFDQHCRDDDWREVLRLICGQIDERFVGRIVEHLASRTKFEMGERRTPLPELPLAIWCLNELRTVAKLGDTGDILLAAVVSLFIAEQVVLPQPFLQEVTESANELSVRWPGQRDIPYKTALPSQAWWHHVYWPKFAAAVLRDQSAIRDLAISEQWAVRWGAIEALAEKWPDETTRTFLAERAFQDADESPRIAALRALVDKWPDETTRKLLAERAVQDTNTEHRISTIRVLADKWPDETMRTLVAKRAVVDADEGPRMTALQALADKWPDETTRTLVTERAVQDADEGPRTVALQALANIWPDQTTRTLLTERAVQDANIEPRNAALHGLADKWPDETSRTFLAERAVQDADESPRMAALLELAEKWPDETTRTLVAARAVQDSNSDVRSTALRILADKWPDETTRALLNQFARTDGFAASRAASGHSKFGRIVFTIDLDGLDPYLDPTQPIPRDHLEEAAKKAGVPTDQVDDTVRLLSAYLGWDIAKGAAP